MADVVSAVPPTMPEVLPPGTPVDRYVLDGVLRDGGMATIYLGHHQATGAKVAIKVLHIEYVHQPDFIARFEREAQVMGRLSGCPQIVSVHDVGALPDGRQYLVMDLIRGFDLRDALDQLASRDETMHVARAVSILRDVAAALAAAHRTDVIHRDIKPSNVMLESSAGREVAKLVDFGISADLGEAGRKQDLTAGGTVIGTARYMAPEQAAGISNVPTVDVWAMGVLLLEMLTGEPPPPGGWGLRGAPLDALPPIPQSLRTLLAAMLEPESTRRIQSAREVEARLIDILPSLGVDVSMLAPVPPASASAAVSTAGRTEVVPPPQRRTPAALWGVAAGVIVASAMTGWWLVRSLAHDDARPDPTHEAVAAAEPEPEAVAAAEPEPEPVAVAEPEPEPVAVAEPQPVAVAEAQTPEAPAEEPEPEPEAKPRPKPRRPATSKKTKDCDAVLQETRDASILGRWKTVLAHTKHGRCWSSDKTERERLRVRALHQLGRYSQCEREGQESGDPTVWSVVELCRKAK